MFKVGDKVKIIKSVWDDHNNCDWWESIGIIKASSPDSKGKSGWYIEFPDTKEDINSFDFYEDEIELLNEDS